MRRILSFALLLLLGAGAFLVIQNQYPEAGLPDLPGKDRIMETYRPLLPAKPQETPEPQSPTIPQEKDRTITCPTCQGEGRLSYLDRREKNHVYACPVCGSSGRRIIHGLPSEATLCPDCRGMGRIQRERRRTDVIGFIVDAEPCQRCNGNGYLTPKVPPGSVAPTRGLTPPQSPR